MMNNHLRLLALLLTVCLTNTYSQTEKMEWFEDAKLGIFIHWGIYAVDGIDESWSFYNGYISHSDYMDQTKGFTAKNYNPQEWADLIRTSGARYAVITSKHHDGFTLWDAPPGSLSAVNGSAAKKDVLSPFVSALRKNKLKVGIYFSLSDWSSDLYTHFTRDSMRYQIADDPQRWSLFQNYFHGQLKDLSSRYKPDLYWFDGDWEHTAEEWQSEKIRSFLLADNPQTILNSRLQGYGDYGTPEQGVPITRPKDRYWELCLTMNDSWGYQKNDHNYKSSGELIGMFAEVLSLGGNLLLDIGPKADGTIPTQQKQILSDLGRWTSKHHQAIYGSQAGIPKDYFYGPSTLSKDGTILYLFVKGNPGGQIALRGLKNKINRIWVVGKGTKLSHKVVGAVYWSQYPGIKYIQVPDYVLDEEMTVLAVLLDGKIDLFGAELGAIQSN